MEALSLLVAGLPSKRFRVRLLGGPVAEPGHVRETTWLPAGEPRSNTDPSYGQATHTLVGSR
jgi:hypothetical protein